MEGCGHCEMLKKVWKQIENKLKNTSLLIVNIDSSVLEFVPYSHDILGFPTIRLVKNGRIIDYNEERTLSKIMQWLKKNKVITKTLKKKIKRRKTLKLKK
jgi:thiol-disulfide isomerase/thioredoxin